ncbi:hypothetical protein BH10BAC3_BH10BAC3_21220 [soil metagenome]
MEPFGKEDEIAMKRIPQSKESLEAIYTSMNEAAIGVDMVEIKSVVNIFF